MFGTTWTSLQYIDHFLFGFLGTLGVFLVLNVILDFCYEYQSFCLSDVDERPSFRAPWEILWCELLSTHLLKLRFLFLYQWVLWVYALIVIKHSMPCIVCTCTIFLAWRKEYLYVPLLFLWQILFDSLYIYSVKVGEEVEFQLVVLVDSGLTWSFQILLVLAFKLSSFLCQPRSVDLLLAKVRAEH